MNEYRFILRQTLYLYWIHLRDHLHGNNYTPNIFDGNHALNAWDYSTGETNLKKETLNKSILLIKQEMSKYK